jgi:hypothetical protein
MSDWLIPFHGRNSSGAYNLNFLWRENNIYVMDNHRASLWCWFQHLKPEMEVNLFHIDRHTDTLSSNLSRWVSNCPDLYNISLNDYLTLDDPGFSSYGAKLFRWDNYGSIFLDKYGEQVGLCYFATYDEGDKPNHPSVDNVEPWMLIDNIDYWMDQKDNWICNVDIDYFCHKLDEDYHIMYSESFIADLFLKIKYLLDKEQILVLTISLSPECCGGWRNSEDILAIVESYLGVQIKLLP